MNDKLDFLARVPLFAELGRDELDTLGGMAVMRSFPRDVIIFQENDYADALYMIREGRVKVVLADEDGHEVIVSILQAGESFGELALIDSEVRCARVVTMTDVKVAMLAKADFQDWLQRNPSIALSLLQDVARRLRLANETIGSLAMLDVHGRVARVLLNNAASEDGQLVVRTPMTQKDIAAMVGASREMVNRVFKQLAEQGSISLRDGQIYIHQSLKP